MSTKDWPAPGWYPDGETDHYWDGHTWASERRTTLSPQPTVAATQPPTVAPKNPALSLIVSFFIPGGGTITNGEVGKGVAILVADMLCFFLGFLLLLPWLGCLGLWIYGMVDGYQGAQRWNLQHGVLS